VTVLLQAIAQHLRLRLLAALVEPFDGDQESHFVYRSSFERLSLVVRTSVAWRSGVFRLSFVRSWFIERRTPNVERRTPNAERRTSNVE
jgi:hypothetical protein